MRYYQAEHESAYRELARRGQTQWNDLFDGPWTYDDFQNRAFLERVLPQLGFSSPTGLRVLEYGCGTGTAACFLAARGFRVDAVDLIPEAIEIGRRMATERGVDVRFSVGDICTGGLPSGTTYDLVLDSYCLQSIVTDEDRGALFSAVRARLKPDGYYVISTAIRTPDRRTAPGHHYDESTGIEYRESGAGEQLGERAWVPHRRHLTPDALRAELAAAGFQVLVLDASDTADLVCRSTTGEQ
ncbi:class I SAM-dependent methyltransferase [Kribbella sp. NPDC051770]|uniref:class I SAM-dependent methyltransferase n=1 Tax=Kribbella sp. NPDC051770 TaxID=3155413 RepID=UPI0034138052